MASQPKPLAKTAAKPEAKPAIYDPPEPSAPAPAVMTIADEQRARSEEIQAQGVEAWKAEHDERDPDEAQKRVPGVGPTTVPGSWEGSTRSTPEARKAQHPAAPR